MRISLPFCIQELLGNFYILLLICPLAADARFRDESGVQLGKFKPAKWNAITDVAGVKVGHVTLNQGAVKTGVTVIIPGAGDLWREKRPAGSFVLNGNGEATGLMWLAESGLLETPIALTNTLNVGTVQKGLLDWILKKYPEIGKSDDTLTPLVLECDDSFLNDIRGQHVKSEHVAQALERAASGPVEEGGVGSGTGLITYQFKGGIGTSSRAVESYTVGVLVNANHGKRDELRILGHALGQTLKTPKPVKVSDGSIIVVLATDAPLDSRQLSRLAKRAMLGVMRTGGTSHHGSGDIALAFSTANRIPHYPKAKTFRMEILSDFWIDPLFDAAAEAGEEAMINALWAGKDTQGRDGNRVFGLPTADVLQILKAK